MLVRSRSPSIPAARRRPSRQVGDLLHQVDLAHDQPRLGVVVEFARAVRHPHVAGHVELRLILIGDADVIGAPGDAAGKIPDLDGDLARHLARDVPLQGVVAACRERRVHQIDLVLMVENPELDAGRVDERIGPGELDAVDAFLDGQEPVLPDHGDVFGVVDRELRALAGGQGHQVHGGQGRTSRRRHEYHHRPERQFPHGAGPHFRSYCTLPPWVLSCRLDARRAETVPTPHRAGKALPQCRIGDLPAKASRIASGGLLRSRLRWPPRNQPRSDAFLAFLRGLRAAGFVVAEPRTGPRRVQGRVRSARTRAS